MMRAFYATSILFLGSALGVAGCEQAPPPPPDGSRGSESADTSLAEVDAALAAIDQWLASAQPDKAEAIARGMVRDAPDLAEGHAALGRVLLVDSGAARSVGSLDVARSQADAARASFKRALELGLEKPEIRRSAGIAAEQAGDLEDAINWYRSGADTDDASALYLGLALLRADRPEEAQSVLEPLASRRTEDPFVHASLAESHSALARHEAALADIEEAVRLAPNEPAFRIRRAAILRQAGKPRQAAETIIALPENVRLQVAATEQLALALMDLGEPELAALAWVARAQASPGDPEAMANAARAFLEANNPDEARGWIELLATSHPDHPELDMLRSDFAATQRK